MSGRGGPEIAGRHPPAVVADVTSRDESTRPSPRSVARPHAFGRKHLPRIDIPDGPGEERERMWRLRPELGEAAEALSRIVQEQSIIPVREHEAARIRIAHINGCEPCSETRINEMERWDLEESFYLDVDDLAKRGRYTEREVLAIEFAERFAVGHDASTTPSGSGCAPPSPTPRSWTSGSRSPNGWPWVASMPSSISPSAARSGWRPAAARAHPHERLGSCPQSARSPGGRPSDPVAPEVVEDEIHWQLNHMTAEVRAALYLHQSARSHPALSGPRFSRLANSARIIVTSKSVSPSTFGETARVPRPFLRLPPMGAPPSAHKRLGHRAVTSN